MANSKLTDNNQINFKNNLSYNQRSTIKNTTDRLVQHLEKYNPLDKILNKDTANTMDTTCGTVNQPNSSCKEENNLFHILQWNCGKMKG